MQCARFGRRFSSAQRTVTSCSIPFSTVLWALLVGASDTTLELVPGLRTTRGDRGAHWVRSLPSKGTAGSIERRQVHGQVHLEAPNVAIDELAQVFPYFHDYRMAGRGMLLRSAHAPTHPPPRPPPTLIAKAESKPLRIRTNSR
jgi:hypothetical protein